MHALLIFGLFIGIPALEIALFIQIGGEIGVWATLGAIILTAIIGTALVRAQGLRVIAELQEETQAGRTPVAALAKGACLLVAGLLLLTPGFFTDAIGFALLAPPVQAALFQSLISKLVTRGTFYTKNPSKAEAGPIVDGDYEVVSPDSENAGPDNKGSRRQIFDDSRPYSDPMR